MKILISGSAGFIGYHLSKKLIDNGYEVYGIDNLNSYYDTKLKLDRLDLLLKSKNFTFKKIDICNFDELYNVFKYFRPSITINLAAQAGVRYSLENPRSYIDSNITGFFNILHLSRVQEIEHFIYASSSSVYGGNNKIPYSTKDNVNNPLSLYAATKKSNELIAHSYSNLYQIPTTGLRFFTVYGPWGRPDMALYKFVSAINNNKEIEIYNNGNHSRDFTYIDDAISIFPEILDKKPIPLINWNFKQPLDSSFCPWKIFNIGNNNPVKLMDFIRIIEKKIGKKAKIKFISKQPGDVDETFAEIENAKKELNYEPKTNIIEGVSNFIDWYLNYYKN